MATVERSVLVEHGAETIRGLVEDIAAYSTFLPWCAVSRIESRQADVTVASLTIDFHGIRQSFATENRRVEEGIRIRLVSGPFRSLDGLWQFRALGATACKVSLTLHYEFSNRLLAAAVGPVFRQIAGSLVDAFVRRADSLAGTSRLAAPKDPV